MGMKVYSLGLFIVLFSLFPFGFLIPGMPFNPLVCGFRFKFQNECLCQRDTKPYWNLKYFRSRTPSRSPPATYRPVLWIAFNSGMNTVDPS